MSFRTLAPSMAAPRPLSSLWIFAIGALIFISAIGCEHNADKTDQTQNLIMTANQNLSDMDQLSEKLSGFGVSVKFRSENESDDLHFKKTLLKYSPAKEAVEIRKALEAYIRIGEETLGIANRDEVQFGQREALETNVKNAKIWLEVLIATH